MVVVRGTPKFPFYMPGSEPIDARDSSDQLLRQRAIDLVQRGYQAGTYISPGDEYIGRVLGGGDIYYQHPRVPGYHFEQQILEGRPGPPRMLPGSLDERIALEIANREARRDEMSLERTDPAMAAYQQIVYEAMQRGMEPRRTREEALASSNIPVRPRPLYPGPTVDEDLARIRYMNSRYDAPSVGYE